MDKGDPLSILWLAIFSKYFLSTHSIIFSIAEPDFLCLEDVLLVNKYSDKFSELNDLGDLPVYGLIVMVCVWFCKFYAFGFMILEVSWDLFAFKLLMSPLDVLLDLLLLLLAMNTWG